MKQITKEIFIGSRNDIFLDAEIIDNKTTVVVTPKNQAFKFPQIKSYLNVAVDLNINGIKLPKVGLIDGKGNDKEILKKAVDTIDSLIKQHGNVMVFGQKGESRSAVVVLAYLYFKEGLPFAKAYGLIRSKNQDIRISPFLSLMLCELSGEKYFENADSSDNPETPTPKTGQKINESATKKRGRPAQKK